MSLSLPGLPQDHLDDGQTLSTGAPLGMPPTAEEAAAFEVAFRAANARFLATALAEDGMPVAVGWRGPEVTLKTPSPTDHAESPHRDQITNSPS